MRELEYPFNSELIMRKYCATVRDEILKTVGKLCDAVKPPLKVRRRSELTVCLINVIYTVFNCNSCNVI